MDRDQFMVSENLHRGVGGLEPEGLADEPERDGIEVLFQSDMGVAMDFYPCPDGELNRHIWQRREQRFFRFGEEVQGPPAGGAVDAVTGLACNPLSELPVGVGEITELAQRQEGIFDVFDPGLYPAFFLRVPGRTRGDAKAVAQGEFFIGPLDFRVFGTGAGNGALGVVDDQFFGYAAEPFEGPSMEASQVSTF